MKLPRTIPGPLAVAAALVLAVAGIAFGIPLLIQAGAAAGFFAALAFAAFALVLVRRLFSNNEVAASSNA